jgi:choline dehydrogenase-like flavoprotein
MMVETLEERPQVVVVGAGVGGGLAAERAAAAGLTVLILESGPRIRREDLVERFRTVAPQSLMSPYPLVPHAPQPNVKRTDDYLIQKGPDPYDQQYIRAVGGTTWHWGAATWRYLPNDMQLRTLYGVGRDWPIDYWTLEPWYYAAEVALGVAGPPDAPYDAPRSKPYPMPPAPLSYLDQVFQAKLEGLGYAVIPAPQCRNNQQVYDGRPPCCGNANCMPICPIGAQYSGNISVEKAEALGARVIENAVVHRIEVGEADRITAVRWLDPDGTEHRVEADAFVLAANGIEGPKLLQMSTQEGWENGVANRSGQVGRNLMDHPGTSHRFDSDMPLWPGRGPMILSGIVNLRDGDFRSDYAARKLMPDNANHVGEVTAEAIEEGLRGRALREAVNWRAARRQIVYSFNEQLPHPDNRIVPSTEKLTDSLGLPRPEIHYRVEEYVRRAKEDTMRRVEEFAQLFGATEVTHNDGFLPNNHIMGATIMGDDPVDSVVNGDCRTHDHPNLWIASSSTFPSGSCVNATLTIAALAIRIGDSVARSLDAG